MVITFLIFVSHAQLIVPSVSICYNVLDVSILSILTIKLETVFLNQIVCKVYSFTKDHVLTNVNWVYTEIIIQDIVKNA